MDHVQGRQQARQFAVAVEQRAGQGFTGQTRAVEFAVEPLLHLLQLLAQQLGQLWLILELLAGSHAQQYRQRGLQGMAEVTQGVARAFEAVFGMGQQVVDLRHQRLQLHRHLGIQLRALALLQLCNLLARSFQRAQGPAYGDPLQDQDQQQRRQPEDQADLAHQAKTFPHGRVVLSHADGNRLAKTLVVRSQDQQLLAFRAQLQVALQAGLGQLRQLLVPQ